MTEPPHLRDTRRVYDVVADDYAELLTGELAAQPLDRALLATFAELVTAAGGGPVADVGCGPGRVTAHLRALGLSCFGIDLSPGMVAVARRTYPHLRFDEGSMTALDLADDSLGGILCWYSIIHTPPEPLPAVLAELGRVLGPGGQLLLAFQAGDGERVHRDAAYGHAVSFDLYRHSPERVAEMLGDVHMDVHTRVLREPGGRERTRQAYLLARKVPIIPGAQGA